MLHLATIADDSFDVVVDGHCLHCIHRRRSSEHAAGDPARAEARWNAGLKSAFDSATGVVAFNGRPTRYIGTAEAIERELVDAGFVIANSRVVARKDASEQDDYIAYARRPGDAASGRDRNET